MEGFKLTLTIPKPNLNWWKSSKSELLKMVKEHHKDSWSDKSDPVTGKAWVPRKKPTGSWPLLRKTGKMLNSTKFKADSRPMLFKATTNVGYGSYHQNGTSRMPQRRWLGLGSDFDDKFAKVVAKKLFKGTYRFTTL